MSRPSVVIMGDHVTIVQVIDVGGDVVGVDVVGGVSLLDEDDVVADMDAVVVVVEILAVSGVVVAVIHIRILTWLVVVSGEDNAVVFSRSIITSGAGAGSVHTSLVLISRVCARVKVAG